MFIPTDPDATAFTVLPAFLPDLFTDRDRMAIALSPNRPATTALTISPTLPADTETTPPNTPPSASPLTASPLATPLPISLSNTTPRPEHVRHLLFGTPAIVQATIQFLHHLGYADPNDWSRPLSTGRPNEVMAILTKRMNLS